MINKFLAKSSGLSLVEHTQDVIAAAEELISRLNLTDAERRYWLDKIILCAKLHDIGKIHDLFQENLILNTSKNSIRHEIISLWLIEQFYNLSEDECFAIATHHKGVVQDGEFGRLTETILQAESPILINDFYDFNVLQQFVTEWSISFGLSNRLKQIDGIKPKFSRDNLINLYADYQFELKTSEQRFQFAKARGLLIASDHIGSAQLQNELPNWKKLRTGMFHPRNKKTGRFLPFRSFQKNLQQVKSDVLLYAPTGSGKTEAALGWYFANQKQNGRLFYLLPYTASINAMVMRLQKVFNEKNPAKPKTVTALHSKTLEFFFEELEKEESNHQKNQDRARTMQSFSKELFFPVKVATPHQVLKNALMGKGWEMSLFDYQNACFIIDEFHTYDALMTGLMLATIKWLKENFNAKVFFMSATIPRFLKELIIEKLYDGNEKVYFQPNSVKASDKAVLGKKRHKLICCKNESIIDKVALILEFLNLGKSVLIIVNNVSTCQRLYNDIDFNGDVKLLHSGFNKRDRIVIEKAITSQDSKPQLLIAK
jgi:CRISPR-associated endonuclease/helicase Cas3